MIKFTSIIDLNNLDRMTQSRFASTREILIETREGASITGHRRNMQGIGNIDTVRNHRERQFHAIGVLDVHSGQTQGALDRMGNGDIIEFVYRTQHPKRFQEDSLAYPYLLGLEGGARTGALGLVIVDEKADEHVGIDCDHTNCREALPTAMSAADFDANACVKFG